MQAHVEGNTDTDALERQASFGCLLKRLFILHSSKLMALAVFWAAMQQPGAIGWLLICKTIISSASSPLLRCNITAIHFSSLPAAAASAGAAVGLLTCAMLDAVS